MSLFFLVQNLIFAGPIYICICCNRLLFKSGVKILNKRDIKKMFEANRSLLEMATSNQLEEDCEECVFCHNCLKVISKDGKCPRMSVSNGLKLDDIPEELELSDPERQLIALDLLFMKIFKLPTSRMRSIKGKMALVPLEGTDILKTLEKLPRKFDESFLVPVHFKRKQCYKAEFSAFINKQKLIAAVTKLKKLGNIHYQFVQIDLDLESEKIAGDENDNDIDASQSGSESDDDNVFQSVSDFQSNQNSNVCWIPNELETLVAENLTNHTITKKKSIHQQTGVSISPGQFKFYLFNICISWIFINPFSFIHYRGRKGCH